MSQTSDNRVSISLTPKAITELDEIALRESEPGARVSRADVVREAIRDYLEKTDEERDPCNRGALDALDEGAV